MKRLTGIFICLLVVLLMSHNVVAYDLSNLVGPPSQTGEFSMTCNSGGNCNSSNNNGIINTFNIKLYNEYSQVRALSVGRYVQLNFYGYKLTDNASNHSVLASLGTPAGGNTGLNILDVKFEMMTTNTYKWTVIAYVSTSRNTYDFDFGNGSLVFRNQEYINSGTWAEFQPKDISVNVDTQSIVNAINDSASQNEQMQQKEEQAVNNIENQTTNDTASELPDTSSATNLIGNIQNIFTQIGNIQPSNCSIPADFGHLDLGNLNLCTGKENLPFIVTFGAYAFELIFVVGASIILVKQVVSMFDWARGDN